MLIVLMVQPLGTGYFHSRDIYQRVLVIAPRRSVNRPVTVDVQQIAQVHAPRFE